MQFLNCAVYLIVTGVFSFFLGRLFPINLIAYDNRLLRTRSWENRLYTFLKVRLWQNKIPDMSQIFPGLMPAKRINGSPSNEQLLIMVKETCIAEYTHIVLCISGLLCLHFLENPWAFTVTFLYIFIGNLPFIIVQRYNRPRLIRLMQAKRERTVKGHLPSAEPNVLILSGGTGGGHNSCAQAISKEYEENGESCVIANGLHFLSATAAFILEKGHVFLYRHMPRFFGFAYRQAEKHAFPFYPGSLLFRLFGNASEHLYSFLLDNSFSTLICTHVFPALLLSRIVKETAGLGIKTCFVATDYNCSPGVECLRTDLCFIPDGIYTREFIKGEITPDKIIVSGIPVSKEFYTHTSRDSIRSILGIPQNARHLLVMSGSMGCSAVMRVVDTMIFRLKKDQYVTIVCGNNKRLERKLKRRYKLLKRIRILGYVPDMSPLMDSADVFLTKPGGLSTTEAAMKNLPMVLIDTVSAFEQYNLLFCTMHGIAMTSKGLYGLGTLCCCLLGSSETTDRMKEAGAALSRKRAADIIRTHMNGFMKGVPS